jgi:hypothetical protein
LIAFWAFVGSLGALDRVFLLAPLAVLALSVVTAIALWWRQPIWAAAIVAAMSLYFCWVATLPLLHGAFDLMLLLHLAMVGLAGRTVVATVRLLRLRREASAGAIEVFD